MNFNPTKEEVVAKRDELLELREEVLKRYFIFEDLLNNGVDYSSEDRRTIQTGLAHGNRSLKQINDGLCKTQKLLQLFDDASAEPQPKKPNKVEIGTDLIVAFFIVLAIVFAIALL